MNPVIDTLKVDLRSTKYQSVTVKQYDENSRIVEIELFDTDEPYNIDGDVDVIFRCTKSDGTYVTVPIPNENVVNNLVKINLPAAALTQAGEVRYDIGIYKKSDDAVGKQVLSSRLYYLYVEKAAYDEKALCSSSVYSVLTKLIDDINRAIRHFNRLVAENQERLNEKVDKIDGMGLSQNSFTDDEKEKLKDIEEQANNYTHPDSHDASMIVEDTEHRFVNDAEKSIYADNLIILIPVVYNGYQIKDCIVTLNYLNENGQGDVISLELSEEIYKESYHKAVIPISNKLTSVVGTLTLWIEIIDHNNNLILKSSHVSINILDHVNVGDALDEQQLTLLQDWEIKMTQLLNSCNIALNEVRKIKTEIVEIVNNTIAMLDEWEEGNETH